MGSREKDISIKLPEIKGDRCVHALIETASCQACVDICPQNAWILDDESLGLNTNLCDGCGLCIPACTEGAITQTKDCTIREENNKKVLLVGCEYINSSTDSSVESNNWKCVHAVSANELLNLYHDGIRQIVVSKADCNTCSRGKNEHLYERVNKLNKMLRHSHLAPLHYNEIPADQWYQLWKTPEKSAPGPEMSRRLFFQSAIKQTVGMVLHHSTLDSAQTEFVPLAKILKSEEGCGRIEGEDALYSAVPIINAEKCNGCDTCFRACPHGALLFKLEDAKARYEIDASACSACNICTDLCEQGAISISQWSMQTQETRVICLNIKQCHSCGTVFHYPRVNGTDAGNKKSNALPRQHCNICEKVNHQKNLFQVFS
ncbi:MAG TPA: hypothetical protein EYH20_04175 [Leucothrix sp.]|nr:hypothetical protein [Leucothrix sp.]